MVGQSYKLPLSLCLLGFEETLIGIRATIYNPDTCEEKGIFFAFPDRNEESIFKKAQSFPKEEKRYHKKRASELERLITLAKDEFIIYDFLSKEEGWNKFF